MEIIVLTAVLVIVALFLPRLGTSRAQSKWSTVAMGNIAIPALRTATTERAETLAELFGLGRYGIRWRHVVVLTIGIWLSSNVPVSVGDMLPALALPSLLWPVFFLFAALTALSVFQSTAASALATGAIYAGLMAAVRLAIDPTLLQTTDFIVRSAALSFSWTFLTMIAMQVAISGQHRWSRMFLALSVVSILQMVVNTRVYLGAWLLDELLGMETLLAAALSDAVWVLTFWFASEGAAAVKRKLGYY